MKLGKKLAAGMLWLLALVFVAGLALEHYLAGSGAKANPQWQGPVGANHRQVFYPRYLPKNCEQSLADLDRGEFRLDGDRGEMIGLKPAWNLGADSSGYANFNLHSLRFVSCLIAAGSTGDDKRLDQAAAIFRSWLAANPPPSPASEWAWTEHATSWRAVVLSYFMLTAQQRKRLTAEDTALFNAALERHADFIRRASVYRPDHNHGLNNALALLAVAMVAGDAQSQRELLQLGFARAEQQIADNVSADGIHLEQSGFYQFYTLRSFLEILRVARGIGWPLSQQYQHRLARMLDAARYMAGKDGKVDGLPYSKPQVGMTGIFALNPELVRDGRLLDVDGAVIDASPRKRLSVRRHGGYSFFAADRADELEIVFHTRILDAPHAHRDPLGVTVRNADGPLVAFTSTMHVSEDSPQWKAYFLGPAAHNGVLVDGQQPVPLSRRRGGLLATIADSWKLNALLASAGLADWFADFRRRHRLDRRSLRERSVPAGGEVLNAGSDGIVDFVTARHATYRGVEQIRTVARIGSRALLVWDRVRGENAQRYVQQFHFAPDSAVVLQGETATIRRHGRVIGKARQLLPHETRLCAGEGLPSPCGWYTDSATAPRATPVMLSAASGKRAEFLWLLNSGAGDAQLQLPQRGEPYRLQIDVQGKRYTVELDSRGVRAKLAPSS